ncbi:MAG: NAD(P)H-dependent oxidoreductase, partial [Lachnospiraceae bacterium]|nr:NAD(P)H-dependent oxidoreductase [Lachnospiraceae bacterium]
MKVLMLNGSPKADGNTYTALLEIGKQLENEGIEYEIVQIGKKPVRDCIGCGKWREDGCIFTDYEV